MKATLTFNWQTDGDFTVNKDRVESYIQFNESKVKPLKSQTWEGEPDSKGSVTMNFKHKNADSCLDAIAYVLSLLSTSMFVSPTYNWLVKDLFDMFDSARLILPAYFDAEAPFSIHTTLEDYHYAGTEINIEIKE